MHIQPLDTVMRHGRHVAYKADQNPCISQRLVSASFMPTTAPRMRLLALVSTYVALRVLIHSFLPPLWPRLSACVELCTPVSSYRSTLEGVYLYTQAHMSPFRGDVFQQSPLLLALFTRVPLRMHYLLFTIADALGALGLAAAAYAQHASPLAVAAAYLFNPFSLLGSLAQSTNVLGNSLLCLALAFAAKRQPNRSAFCFGLAVVLQLYPLHLLLAFAMLLRQQCGTSLPGALARVVAYVLAFLTIAHAVLQSWDFVSAQYLTLLTMPELTRPNIGLWWYFFVEIFDEFRAFYTCVFQLFLVSLSVPLALRLPGRPLVALTVLAGFLATFKPYPESSDLGLVLTLLLLSPRVLSLLSNKTLVALGFLYWAFLSPTFYYLWIYSGSGNSNFFYTTNLVYAATMIVLLADFTWAALRDEYDGGKDPTVTQI